jgi:hypothetical protein
LSYEKIKEKIAQDISTDLDVEFIEFIGSINKIYYNIQKSDIDIVIFLTHTHQIFEWDTIRRVTKLKSKYEALGIKLGITLFSSTLQRCYFYNIKLLSNYYQSISKKEDIDFKIIILAENYYFLCKLLFAKQITSNERKTLKCFLHIYEMCSVFIDENNSTEITCFYQKLTYGSSLSKGEIEYHFTRIGAKILSIVNRSLILK